MGTIIYCVVEMGRTIDCVIEINRIICCVVKMVQTQRELFAELQKWIQLFAAW